MGELGRNGLVGFYLIYVHMAFLLYIPKALVWTSPSLIGL